MKATCATLLLTFCVPAVISTVHTACFNYFLEKDGCVFSSASAKTRCPAPSKDHPSPVQTFNLASGRSKRDNVTSFQRRYDTTQPSQRFLLGNRMCGNYDSTAELGVCLWSGTEQSNPSVETAGWLNRLKTSNCGKRVYIQRAGQPNSVQYAKVLDGCSFSNTALDTGCYQIALSLELFNRFNPTAEEKSNRVILGGITWDFDNLNGHDPRQGPV